MISAQRCFNFSTSSQRSSPRIPNAKASSRDKASFHERNQVAPSDAGQTASEKKCRLHAAPFAQYDGPNSATSSAAADIMAKSHRTLIVDYAPGSPKQAWGLVSKGG